MSSKWESNSDLDMVMVSEGDVSRLCVSKEPVRSKVTVSEDMGRKAVRREGMAAVRRMRREAPLLANIVCCVWPLQSLIQKSLGVLLLAIN